MTDACRHMMSEQVRIFERLFYCIGGSHEKDSFMGGRPLRNHFFASILTACNNPRQQYQTITITDMAGDVVEVSKNPEKIAVLARSAVDMLVGFGLGKKITGIYYTVFDNEWAGIIYPAISSYEKYDYNTTLETYLEHGVELVFCPEQYLAVNLREHGIPAVTISQYGNPNYDNYVFYFADMIKEIWDDASAAAKVEAWKIEFAGIRDQITTALENVPTTKSLFYVRGDKNKGIAYTEASDKTIQNTVCKYLKLDYAGKGFASAEPTTEAVLELDPDYIIVGGAFQNSIIGAARDSSVWQNLSAFQNDKVFNIGMGFVMFEQNGVELTVYLADLANKIYPDIFSFDVSGILKNTVKTYFGTELSDADISNMLQGLKRNGQPLA
jgi:iron complex transport system substrate-binding protein